MQSFKAPTQVRDLLAKARHDLRPIEVKPGTDHDRIMYDAGIQFALNWLEMQARKDDGETVVQSVPRDELPSFHESTLRKAFGGSNAL